MNARWRAVERSPADSWTLVAHNERDQHHLPYPSVFMSITNLYFTSFFTMRE
jgi:hypothetical protein